MYVSMYASIHVCVYECIYVCMYFCLYVCIYICTYVCTFVYTHHITNLHIIHTNNKFAHYILLITNLHMILYELSSCIICSNIATRLCVSSM